VLPRRNKLALCLPWSLLLIKYKLLLLCAPCVSERLAAIAKSASCDSDCRLARSPLVFRRHQTACRREQLSRHCHDSFRWIGWLQLSWLVGGRRLTAATTRTRRGFKSGIRWERSEMRHAGKRSDPWAISSIKPFTVKCPCLSDLKRNTFD